MNDVRVQLPDPLYAQLLERVANDETSVQEFVSRILAEALDQLRRFDEIQERVGRGQPGGLPRALAKVPSMEPPEYDRVPERS